MSLVVSLRVPDGVVLAADSLSTAFQTLQLQLAELTAKCPKCSEDIHLSDLKLLSLPVPMSSFSYAQKLFPLYGKYGMATYGINVLAGRTIYHHVKQMQREQPELPESLEALRLRH